LTLKQLETFYWVSRLRSFVLAAERLHSTQSAVSMRIKDLEVSLGVSLFDRTQRSAQLTAKGQELLKYAEQMIATASQIRDRVGDPEVLSITFRLGVTELVAVTWLPKLVRAINETYPRVTVELGVDLTLIQLGKLESGDLDLAILPGPITIPGLQNISLGTVQFNWMASPKLKVPSTSLTPQNLCRWPLLTMTHQSNLHKMLGTWFDQNDVAAIHVDVCNSIGVLAALTIAGLGVSYLPRQKFETEIRSGKLQVLNTVPKLPHLEYFAVLPKRNAQPLAAMVAELARRHTSFNNSKHPTRQSSKRTIAAT
jgi:DNA-binding transcriptional LysR family regulator